MAITTIDGALAGMIPPVYFQKAVGGVMVAGRAHSFWNIAGYPPAAGIIGSSIAITSSSTDNPTILTTATHGLSSSDEISISGLAGSTPAIVGNYTVTVTDATHFTIPVNASVAGTGGVLSALTTGAAGTKKAGMKGEVLTAPVAGQIPFANPGVGYSYLARLQGSATIAGTLLLCDRLWQNSGIHPTITTEQTFTDSLQIPARDNNGANTGVGVYGMVECQTALGNGTATYTFKYTDAGGLGTVTSTNIMATANGPTLGDAYIFGLAAGSTGVQKAISFTASGTSTSGSMGIVLFRPIAALECPSALVPNAIDALTGGFARVYNNSVLFLMFIPSTTTTSNLVGQVVISQG